MSWVSHPGSARTRIGGHCPRQEPHQRAPKVGLGHQSFLGTTGSGAGGSCSQALPGYRQLPSPQSSPSHVLDSMPFGEPTGPSDLGPCFPRSLAITWVRRKTLASSVTSTARHPGAALLGPTPARVRALLGVHGHRRLP